MLLLVSIDSLYRIMLVGPSHCEDSLSKHKNMHEIAVNHDDPSNNDDPDDHDDGSIECKNELECAKKAC